MLNNSQNMKHREVAAEFYIQNNRNESSVNKNSFPQQKGHVFKYLPKAVLKSGERCPTNARGRCKQFFLLCSINYSDMFRLPNAIFRGLHFPFISYSSRLVFMDFTTQTANTKISIQARLHRVLPTAVI
jgi:hypothetical protein